MAIQAYTLVQPWDGKEAGAVLVQTTADAPFDLPKFRDADEAEEFLQWVIFHGDLRTSLVDRIYALHGEWVAMKLAEEGE